MSNDSDEFTFRGLGDLEGLRKHLREAADSGVIGVTCTACGSRVDGTFLELLEGIKCKCGQMVRTQKFKPPRKKRD